MLAAPGRVLVINVSRIGDTLLVTPALRALAARWPGAPITFLGHPKRVEVMQHLPFLAGTAAISKQRAWWRGWLSRGHFDLAVVYGFDRPLVAYALRVARAVAAFRQDDPSLDRRLFRCVEPPPYQGDHAVPLRLALTRALGVPDAGMRLSYTVTAQERAAAQARIARLGLRDAKPLVGVQLRAFPTKAWRDWPADHFAALCRRISERWHDAHFLLIGSADDRDRIAQFIRQLPGRATSLAGTLTLRESAAVMGELHLFIGPDSGPAHIMSALDPPMIVLYHCLSPSRLIKPLERPRSYAIDHPRQENCSPETSMADISVDAVWDKVVQALQAT